MEKVVKTGLKFDLHIHSVVSAHKDGIKVKNNTLENIGVLIERLNDNKVNLCSITDHDNFSYEMYRGLKAAESMDNSILRVLPGVEFSVCFASEGKESVIHVVTIFSDENDVKVQNLERILQKNRPNYNDAYREEEFLALLREVDMNTILIAHQKNTLTSRNPRKNDANSLGNQQFLEFVYTDYFEAFEFKNRRNEVLNKTFLFQQDIVELIRYEHALRVYKPNVETQKILPHSNQILDYEFISKLNIDEISIDYFNSVLSKTLKIGKKINWETITENDLKDMLLRYDDTEVLQFFKSAINEVLNQDFSAKYSIISQGTDKYAEMSSGLDSKIYFDLLCSETHHDGVYLIDQPEDNISQKAIKDYLLDRFKNMGEVRQVIMVTHNPQFIVNLDVDNLIFLSKDESGLKIRSGALEYECPEYNILDIVAQNIDGGLDSIRKRWKRYEKTAVL